MVSVAMVMTTIRLGARAAKNRQDVIDWLAQNVGSFLYKEDVVKGYDFVGTGWVAKWRQFGAGWFIDVTFDDPKHAAFFTLRWK